MSQTIRRMRKISEQIKGSIITNTPIIIEEVLYRDEIDFLCHYVNRHVSGKISLTIKKVKPYGHNSWYCTITYK